jgi:hypothetical protein
VKALVAKRTVGEYVLDVAIHDVMGVLKPGTPVLAFGTDRIGLRLPVSIAGGSGNASVHLAWDSKGLAANAICGDTDVTKAVSGSVVPADYLVEGGFGITASGDSVTLRPDFGELKVKITVEASEAAWKAVDEVIQAQGGACRSALEKIDLKAVLARLVGRGFNVKIPPKIFKPIRLPAGVRSSLKLQGVDLALHVKATGLTVTPDRIWYGANLTAGTGVASPAPGAAGKDPRPSVR